jgi:hypothetical protein
VSRDVLDRAVLRQTMAAFCEYSNELQGYTKNNREFLHQLGNYSVSRRTYPMKLGGDFNFRLFEMVINTHRLSVIKKLPTFLYHTGLCGHP